MCIYIYIHTYVSICTYRYMIYVCAICYLNQNPMNEFCQKNKKSTHLPPYGPTATRPPAAAVAPHWLSTASVAPPSVRCAKTAAAPAQKAAGVRFRGRGTLKVPGWNVATDNSMQTFGRHVLLIAQKYT